MPSSELALGPVHGARPPRPTAGGQASGVGPSAATGEATSPDEAGLRGPRRRGTRAPAAPGADGGPQALRQACQQFEAVFLAKLLDKMRDTVPEDPLLGDSRAHDVYYSMLDWELAQQMARTQGVGLAEMLYRQLSAYLGEQSGDEAGAAPPGDE